MKPLHYLPLAILACSPITSFAHQVPYGASHCANSEEQADAEEIPLCTKEEKEKSAALAFCVFTGRPDLENCAQSIKNHGMAEAAGKCVDEALQKQVDLKDELTGHKTGGTAGSSDGAHWHTDYKYSKENGWHRHDWSDAARDVAGRSNGTLAVREAKENSAVNKTTSESTSDWNVGGAFKISVGIGSTVDHEANGNKGGGKTDATEKGPLTQGQIDKTYKEAYDRAYADPNITNVNPNITCEKDKPKCSTSFSRDYVNEDYQPQGKKTEDKQLGNGSGNSSSGASSGGQEKGNTPTLNKSTTDVTPPNTDHEMPNVYAGDPNSVTMPGEMLASYDQSLANPISKCLFESFKEEISKDTNKTFNPEGPNKTSEQRKKEAQGLLRKGICDAKYFGPAFCQKHKTFKLTGGQKQDPLPEKTTIFEELKDMGKIDAGNPKDYQDKTPIDFSRLPKTSPDGTADKLIVLPGR